MAFFNIKKILCLGALLSLSSLLHANSSHNIYMMTLSIMSYVKWNTSTPSLCIVDNPNMLENFSRTIKQQSSSIKTNSVKSKDPSIKECDAIFFSNTTPVNEQKLISASTPPLLSFSNNNIECEIGSAFCLYSTKSGNTQFKVNLDSLAKAKIHVDPRVLLLAQSSE